MMESVRPAIQADVADLAALAEECRDELAGEKGGSLWDILNGRGENPVNSFLADLNEQERGEALILVGEFDGVIAGYAAAHIEPLVSGERLCVMTDVFVEVGFRGVGIGEAMMTTMVDWARSQGCCGMDSVALPGMRHSKNFFERFGLTARAILVNKRFEIENQD